MSMKKTLRAGFFASSALLGGVVEALARDSNPSYPANFVQFLGDDASVDSRGFVKKGHDYIGLACDNLVRAFQVTDRGLVTAKFSPAQRPHDYKDVIHYTQQGNNSYGAADIVDETDRFKNERLTHVSVAELIKDGVMPSNVEQVVTNFQLADCSTSGGGGNGTPVTPGETPPPPPPPPPPTGCGCEGSALDTLRKNAVFARGMNGPQMA